MERTGLRLRIERVKQVWNAQPPRVTPTPITPITSPNPDPTLAPVKAMVMGLTLAYVCIPTTTRSCSK